jgi:hypothetical protein
VLYTIVRTLQNLFVSPCSTVICRPICNEELAVLVIVVVVVAVAVVVVVVAAAAAVAEYHAITSNDNAVSFCTRFPVSASERLPTKCETEGCGSHLHLAPLRGLLHPYIPPQHHSGRVPNNKLRKEWITSGTGDLCFDKLWGVNSVLK